MDGGPVDDPCGTICNHLVEHDVLGDTALRDDLDLLVDDVNSLLEAITIAPELKPLTLEMDLSRIGLIYARDNLYEGALSCAIFAD
jgi:hypothetical protein